MEVVVTTGAIRCAKLQSNRHNQQTTKLCTGRMSFLSTNQQCPSTEGKISHPMDLLTPSSPGGLPTFYSTTNSPWLPWGRVAMPLISPLMPVTHKQCYSTEGNNTDIKCGKTFYQSQRVANDDSKQYWQVRTAQSASFWPFLFHQNTRDAVFDVNLGRRQSGCTHVSPSGPWLLDCILVRLWGRLHLHSSWSLHQTPFTNSL